VLEWCGTVMGGRDLLPSGSSPSASLLVRTLPIIADAAVPGPDLAASSHDYGSPLKPPAPRQLLSLTVSGDL
jgi:hypothetical protein